MSGQCLWTMQPAKQMQLIKHAVRILFVEKIHNTQISRLEVLNLNEEILMNKWGQSKNLSFKKINLGRIIGLDSTIALISLNMRIHWDYASL